jgi:hypothetical protein
LAAVAVALALIGQAAVARAQGLGRALPSLRTRLLPGVGALPPLEPPSPALPPLFTPPLSDRAVLSLSLTEPAGLPAHKALLRKLGLGLTLGGPVLAGTSFYFVNRSRELSRSIEKFCQGGCVGESVFQQTGHLSETAQWALMGAGAAALVGGGALLWSTQKSTKLRLSFDFRAGGPIALIKGTF